VFDNDANCFALAEAWLGAAAPFRDGVVFGVIMGTGVGGGLVLGGRPWSGAQGIAGEWGHHAVWGGAADARACYCGQRGCLERYIAGPALEEAYQARSGARLSMPELAARRGDDVHAAAVIEALLETFGRALANVIDILDPAVVVLGGGLSNLDLLYDEGRARVEKCVFNDELRTPIVRHALGDSAGVLGAALLAFDAQPAGAPA
jgi:fructokinase